jgi:putative hemolysin
VVPETKVLTEMLEEFRERKRHLAVVVDEFGSTAGVVTVEDILEQIVGDIEDEFDVTPPEQPLLEEGKIALVLEGGVGIRELESQYQLTLPRDGVFETLAGFILARLQKIPKVGDGFDFEGHRYTVEEMEGHRIAKVRVEKLEAARVG